MKPTHLKYNPSKFHEDRLLENYFKEKGGILYTEVRVGMGGVKRYPRGARPRRIDAVRLAGGEAAIVPFNRKSIPDFLQATRDRKIEVIEIKRRLNRPAIGQVIVGAKLMEKEYPDIRRVLMVIVCEIGDPVLEMICRELKIRVWKPK